MSSVRNNRLAAQLFSLYLLFYSGFILINIFAPQLMEMTPLAGVNVAIWYGFGLIILAVILAFLYGLLCQPIHDRPSESSVPQSGKDIRA
ncbi:MAG: DUF485 domain-containing protein [Planctomycetaceae bacterium]|nr:DUF485 domain-containing protein [Planctomycetaceae bacterium]